MGEERDRRSPGPRRIEVSRLLVHVEGETEETFVNKVLSPYLYNLGYSEVSARLMGNDRWCLPTKWKCTPEELLGD